MALVFVNGQAPDYTGFTFSNSTDLTTRMHDAFVEAGWTINLHQPGETLVVKATSDNEHTAVVQFVVKENTSYYDAKYLVMRGWHEDSLQNGSPDDYHRFSYVDNESFTNRLWLTLDQDSGAICISGTTGTSAGAHFGFLERIEPTDPWAWMVGWIHSEGWKYAYAAKSKYNDVTWKNINTYYQRDDGYGYVNFYPLLTLDKTCQGKPYVRWEDSNAVNAFYYQNNGKRNYNDLPLISYYAYLEGRANNDDYPGGTYQRTFYRGKVKHAVTGVASEQPTAIFTDNKNGFKYLSTGSLYWQGMRIL